MTYDDILAIQPVVTFAVGLGLLVAPRLLSVILGAYFMYTGMLQLWPSLF
jgi:hypothetical protein